MINVERLGGRSSLAGLLVTILLIWLAVLLGFISALPVSDTNSLLGDKSQKLLIVLVPVILSVGLVLVRGDIGFGLIVFVATGLISKTGMQLDVGIVRTSALEVFILLATLLLLPRRAQSFAPPRWPTLVLNRPLLLLALLTLPALFIAYERRVLWEYIITELKGYFLYPFLAYLLVAWLNAQRRLRAIIYFGIVAALVVAGSGIWSWYTSGIATADLATTYISDRRVAGIFGIINQYSFYLTSMALLTIGICLQQRHPLPLAMWLLVSMFLVAGMAVAGTRAAWLGLVIGLGVFLLKLRSRSWLLLLSVLIPGLAALWLWQLRYFGERLLSLNDNSALERVDYLNIGRAVLTQYPIFGAGWGTGFYLGPDNQLIPSGLLPWLHNDYLNILTQVGIVGFVPFVWLWITILRTAFVHIRLNSDAALNYPLMGALAGLIGLLVQAATDHVFWRPDIAGQVWWLVGILLAGVNLLSEQDTEIGETRSHS